jgi:hypothetical protein
LGICVLCNNLEGRKLVLDGKVIDCCRCNKNKFDRDNLQSFYSLNTVVKNSKDVDKFGKECDQFDDRIMKDKSVK